MAYPSTGLIFSFARPNANPVGQGFLAAWSSNPMQITGNQLAVSTVDAQVYWSTTKFAPDSEAWARIGVLPGAGQIVAVFSRITDTVTPNYYGVRYATGTGWQVVKNIAGGGNVVIGATSTITTPVAGDLFGLTSIGTWLISWHIAAATNVGTIVHSFLDSALAAPTGAWVGIEISDTVGRLDFFGGGSIVPPVLRPRVLPQSLGPRAVGPMFFPPFLPAPVAPPVLTGTTFVPRIVSFRGSFI